MTTSSSAGPACGDGTVDPDEKCDDGNTAAGDGCAADCTIENGFVCTGAPSACVTVCGDGIVAGDEACDDGNTTPGDGCALDCKTIDEGWTCTGAPSDCATSCGDGIIAGTEVCDDGNTDAKDGCAADCAAVEDGFTCDTASPTICAAICGDGKVVGVEKCDDNNTVDGDGCAKDCSAVEDGYTCDGAPSTCVTTCGDGIVAGAETCDDMNTTDADGCSATCVKEIGWDCAGTPTVCTSICGDGIIVGTEACDDQNTLDSDGCNASCAMIEAGWSCVGAPSVCNTSCGDGVIAGNEVCDDLNHVSGDGCNASCTAVEAGFTCTGAPSTCVTTCGDGIIAGTENCDDHNMANGDGCSSSCKAESGYQCAGAPSVCATVCGDGIVAGAEACDDFNIIDTDGCSSDCKKVEPGFTCTGSPSVCVTSCGDGFPAGAETCDDGNNVNGDGCSSNCTAETGFACSGAPSVCAPVCGDGIKVTGEKCDDGNTNDNDCCSSTCQLVAGCEIEPNDTIATANNFANIAGASNKVKGFISPSSDKDVYLVVIPAGVTGSIRAETLDGPLGTTCASNKVDTTINIYDAQGTSLGTDALSGDGTCALLTVTGLAAGNYYVEVVASTLSALPFDYTLNIQLGICGNGTLEAGEQCDDTNTTNGDGCNNLCKLESQPESEPNDACASADGPYVLPPNVLVSGNISSLSDNDYYAFTLTNFADVQFETFDSNGPGTCATIDTEMQVYNSSCVSLGSAVDQGAISNCTRIGPVGQSYMKHLAPGTYYVRVFAWPFTSTTSFNYTLLATTPALCGNGVKEGSEACDGGSFCNPDCTVIPACGNGVVEAGETCDDGANVNGDGCSASCAVEPNYSCNGSPSVCATICPGGQTPVVLTSTNVPLAIPDNNPTGVSSAINVTQTGNVQKVLLTFNITHTYDADLDISLVSPLGTAIDISSDNGFAVANFTNTQINDTCGPITSGTAPYSGCYAPEQPLSTLNGQAAAGTWNLKIVDDAGSDTGTLNSWQLTLCVQ